jgi:hypothetical protein
VARFRDFETPMPTRHQPTCDDCYFRRELLCALRLPEPCPTFRPASRHGLVPPRQPQLVAQPVHGYGASDPDLDSRYAVIHDPYAIAARAR